jgi:MFS family permease
VGTFGHNGSAEPAGRPSRARLTVLAFVCSLSFVLYLDRVCIAQAVKPIQQEMDISNRDMGLVLMAFTLAYGLFEVPVGHWGDRVGARRVLTRIILWWSAFTALTAACWSLGSLLVVRFLFGAGEAGAYPNVARVIRRWFPAGERGKVQGLFMTCSSLGGATAPVLAAYLIGLLGWRWVFVIFGLVGVAWAAAFVVWFRDDPAAHPAVNPAERALIGLDEAVASGHHSPIPWRAVFRHQTLWVLAALMICASFNAYLYISWYPTYLQNARGVGQIRAGWLASLVLAGSATGMLAGGILADWITRLGPDRVRWRRRLGVGAYVLAAGWLYLSTLAASPELSAGLIALSCVTVYLQQAGWWSSMVEISGRHVGALFGLANGMGVFGAMASQFFFGAFADWRAAQGYTGRDQWDPAFGVYLGVLFTAAACWCFVDPTRPVVAEPDSGKTPEDHG